MATERNAAHQWHSECITIVASEFTTDYCEISMLLGWQWMPARRSQCHRNFFHLTLFRTARMLSAHEIVAIFAMGDGARAYISSHPTRCICTELAQIRYSSLDIG